MRTRVKICGVMRVEDAVDAAAAGADAVGMILCAKSPRCIDTDRAAAIVGALPPFVSKVGVFVDASPAFVAQCVRKIPLDFVQLHGHETPEYLSAIISFKVIRAVSVSMLSEWARVDASNLVALLVDSPNAGSGIENDWDEVERQLSVTRPGRPIILAGGLTPVNVGKISKRFAPLAVDVSSGVETSVGEKSTEKMTFLVSEVNR